MRKVEPSIGPVDIVGGEEKSQLKGHLRELMGENCRNRRKVKRAGKYKERTMTVMMTMVMIFRIKSHLCDWHDCQKSREGWGESDGSDENCSLVWTLTLVWSQFQQPTCCEEPVYLGGRGGRCRACHHPPVIIVVINLLSVIRMKSLPCPYSHHGGNKPWILTITMTMVVMWAHYSPPTGILNIITLLRWPVTRTWWSQNISSLISSKGTWNVPRFVYPYL